MGAVIQGSECCKWRLIYAKFALKRSQKCELEIILLEVLYVCGDSLSAIECDDSSVLNQLHTRCNSPIEISYYSARNSPICYFCGAEDVQDKTDSDCYPACSQCSQTKTPVPKRRRAFKPKD